MFVPQTADLRATVSTLRSLEGSKVMGFKTLSLSLSKDRCLLLLVKTLGRQTPEEIIQEKLEAGDLCHGSLAAPIMNS